MTAYYTVIQYVPDPIADERINIGVIVFDRKVILPYFIQNWRRVQSFAAGDSIKFLEDFGKDVIENIKLSGSSQLRLAISSPIEDWNEELIQKAARTWRGSIQFTEPRASLDTAEELLPQIVGLFLHEPMRNRREFRDKVAARRAANAKLAAALTRFYGPTLAPNAEVAVNRGDVIPGKIESHTIDFVARNGGPIWAAQAMSFEVAEGVDDDVTNYLWAARDIKDNSMQFEMAVLALPPQSGQTRDAYARAQTSFPRAGVQLIPEGQFDDWASDAAKKLEPYLAKFRL